MYNPFNEADKDGCNFTMYCLSPYFSTEVEWQHTSTSQDDEYCQYDMDWTATVGGQRFEYCVENKDRRINRKTGEPQYFDKYDTVMFNPEKYAYLIGRWQKEKKIPLYTSDYADGVWVLDLRFLPTPIEQFEGRSTFRKYTCKASQEQEQIRLYIPKHYGKFYPFKQGNIREIS